MKYFTLLCALFFISFAAATAQSLMSAVPAEDYPFVITANAEDPALYYIYTGRDGQGAAGGCVFTNEIPYGETVHKLQLMYPNPNQANPAQLWYFMEAADGNIKIISAADGRMITVADTKDGAKKIFMQTETERTNDFYTWQLDKTGSAYAFRTSDGKTFLSHNGNWATAGPQMGLYNANGSRDEGSRVFFEAYTDPTGIRSAMTTVPVRSGICDLSGRRLQRISAPGIYIIDGKKRWVR